MVKENICPLDFNPAPNILELKVRCQLRGRSKTMRSTYLCRAVFT